MSLDSFTSCMYVCCTVIYRALHATVIVIVITVNFLSVHGCMHGMRVCVANTTLLLIQQLINNHCNVDVFL